MPLLLLLILALLLVAPWVVLPLLAYIVLGLIFLAPFVITAQALVTLVTVPWQIVHIALDRRVRQNHSLEHATVNVMEETLGLSRVSGLATPRGYYLSGELPSPPLILECAQEALHRLRSGEHELAIHRHCGTSMAAASFIFSLVFVLGLLSSGWFSLWTLLVALLASHLLGRPMGELLQRYFTTDPHVDDLEIEGIELRGWSLWLLPVPRRCFVRTRRRLPQYAWF